MERASRVMQYDDRVMGNTQPLMFLVGATLSAVLVFLHQGVNICVNDHIKANFKCLLDVHLLFC